MTIEEELAGFAVSARPADSARRMMRLSLMDCLACGLAGAGEPVARILRQAESVAGGREQASAFGTAQALPARSAALVNGVACHALDYDDTHFAHIGHPSTVVVPAALAMGEAAGASGDDILDAALLGAEASIRVGIWLGRAHYQGGFHQTGTAGAFGATITAARLCGLDAGGTRQALGAVSTMAAGLKSQFGTMGKPLNAGRAAAAGVEAATLAKAGFTSNPRAMTEAQGFGPTHAGQGEAGALDGLGQRWLFEGISHKFHACCHGLHAMLEALRAVDIPATEIRAVRVSTHPRWISVCNQPAPRTGLEAKFSYRLTAAMALAGWDTAALESYSGAACIDPTLVTLRDRVEVVPDNRLAETEARVEVDGTHGAARHRHDLMAPIPVADREARLLAKSRALIGPDRAGQLADATLGDAPRLDVVAGLMRAAAGDQSATSS